MDIIDIVKRDHEKIVSILDRLDETAAAGARQRHLDRLMEELTKHSRAEEQILYPKVAEFDRDLIRESKREHRNLDRMLLRLATLDPHSERFGRKIDELRAALERHVLEEERPGGTLEQLQINVPEAERRRMGHAMRAAKPRIKPPMMARAARTLTRGLRRRRAG